MKLPTTSITPQEFYKFLCDEHKSLEKKVKDLLDGYSTSSHQHTTSPQFI
jgi:hypothetical protein